MILKRIMSSLRKQRWSDLGLELLVVVVGIFLALQADSWYQSRTEQKQLSVYLQALTDELGTSAWMTERFVGWHERVIDGLGKALDRLDAKTLSAEDLELAYFGLTHLSNPPTSPQRHAILNTMQSEGMLRLVDPELLQLLGELVMSRANEYRRHVASIHAPPFPADMVDYAFGPEGGVVIASVDWDAASADPAFRHRVFQGIGAYRYLLWTHKSVLLVHEQALEKLQQLGYQPSGNWLAENQEAIRKRLSE